VIFGALMDAGAYREVWLGVALAQLVLIATRSTSSAAGARHLRRRRPPDPSGAAACSAA